MVTSCASAAALTSLFPPPAFFEAVASTVSVLYIERFHPTLAGFSRQVMDNSHDIVRDVKKRMLDALHAREDISGRVRGYRVESRTKGLVSTFRKVRYLFLPRQCWWQCWDLKTRPHLYMVGVRVPVGRVVFPTYDSVCLEQDAVGTSSNLWKYLENAVHDNEIGTEQE